MANRARQELLSMVRRWQEQANHDEADPFKYTAMLYDLLRQADVRFSDYEQFALYEGPFCVRLLNWLKNVRSEDQRKCLFRLTRYLTFVDETQIKSLHRDAFRRVVLPWLTRDEFTRDDFLSPLLNERVVAELKKYHICSVTESFNVALFKQVNSLQGIPKMDILGEKLPRVRHNLAALVSDSSKKGIIILEDMVGTGKQAGSVLSEVQKQIPDAWRCLFVPLIIQDLGLRKLRRKRLPQFEICAVLDIAANRCIRDEPVDGEPSEFPEFRGLIKRTAARVTERFNEYDDPPKDPFGYEGSGALLVTSHNVPNNTLPLIHHRAPDWVPLFRRVHHAKG